MRRTIAARASWAPRSPFSGRNSAQYRRSALATSSLRQRLPARHTLPSPAPWRRQPASAAPSFALQLDCARVSDGWREFETRAQRPTGCSTGCTGDHQEAAKPFVETKLAGEVWGLGRDAGIAVNHAAILEQISGAPLRRDASEWPGREHRQSLQSTSHVASGAQVMISAPKVRSPRRRRHATKLAPTGRPRAAPLRSARWRGRRGCRRCVAADLRCPLSLPEAIVSAGITCSPAGSITALGGMVVASSTMVRRLASLTRAHRKAC